MVKYRRYFIHGAIYFFTVVLYDRESDFLVKYIQQLKDAMKHVRRTHPYKTIAIVVLPDHLHVVWQLPEKDKNFSLRWRCIKTQFAKNLKKIGVLVEKNIYGENILWQRRFWEHVIRDENDYEKHVNYIHYNPVKHKLVTRVIDWPYSSFHQYVKRGILPENWSSWEEDFERE